MNRVSLTDTTLPVGGGDDGESPIFAPKGTMFDTSYYVLHRQQSIWGPTAEDFDPDRWETFKPGAWTFLPFGAGPRGYVHIVAYISHTDTQYFVKGRFLKAFFYTPFFSNTLSVQNSYKRWADFLTYADVQGV